MTHLIFTHLVRLVVVFSIVLTVSTQELELVGKQIQPRQIIKPEPVQTPCLQPPSGMVAWWPLDEMSGTTVTNIVSGLNGTTQPGPIGGPSGLGPTPSLPSSFPPGMVGSSLFFGGTRIIRVPHNPNLDPGTGSFAVDAWFIWGGGSGPIIQKMLPTGEGWGVFIVVSSTNPSSANVEVRWKFASGTSMPVLSLPITANQWYHLFAGMERNIVAPALSVLALNGTWFVNTSISIPTTDAIATTADLLIGGDGVSPGARIAVDEVEIFNRSLTVQEVQALYNAGSAGKCKATADPDEDADLGDAPDPTNHPNKPMMAYSPTVTANFPTVFDPATGLPQGPKHLNPKGLAWLGPDVSCENEADQLPDCDGVTNIDPSNNLADRDKFDDGVALPIAIPLVCGQTQFKYTVTSTAPAELYVNVWFDFNRDGDWNDPITKCPLGPAMTGSFTEWAVQNQLITVSSGLNTFTTPAFGAANPTKGSDMWMRITLTDAPIAPAQGADGSGPAGGYKYGETEDYLLRLSYSELCGIKFSDLNGNGKQDPNEPGLAGWTIEVKDANGNIIGYAETDANGEYCIVVPSPGTYTVSEQQEAGWVQTAPPAPGTYTVTVPPAHTDLNFGNQQEGKAEICVFKFNDRNGNGRQDSNEVPLPGWQFTVSPAPLPPTTSPVTTGAQGDVCFGVNAPGTYTITEIVQAGWTPTTPNPQTVTVSPGQLANVFFGNKPVCTIFGNRPICIIYLNPIFVYQPAQCVQPPTGMVGWWPLDETSGTTANDLSGFNNQGTHVNGPTPTSGKVAGALRFDGVDDHVRVPDHAELDVGTGNFTLDAWVRTSASSGVVVLVDKRSGPTPLGYALFLANGKLGFQMANGVGSSLCAPTPTAGVACVNYGGVGPSVADGQWHHVAAVVDRADSTSGVRLYVDGVQVFTGAPMTGNLDNASDLFVGVRTPAQQGGGFFRGDLDEVELINRALTQQEIQALYNAGSAGKCRAKR